MLALSSAHRCCTVGMTQPVSAGSSPPPWRHRNQHRLSLLAAPSLLPVAQDGFPKLFH